MRSLKTTSKRIWVETFIVLTIVGVSAQFFSENLAPKQLMGQSCAPSSSCENTTTGFFENCCCDHSLK